MKGPSPQKLSQLLKYSELSDLEKAYQLTFSQPFSTWFRLTKDYNAERWIKEIDWGYLDQALDIQADLLWNAREQWTDDDESLFGRVAAKRAVVWAILDEHEPFDEQLRMLLGKHLSDLDCSEDELIPSPWRMSESHWGCVVNAMRCIDKVHWVLPSMLEYLAYLQKRLPTKEQHVPPVLLDYYDYLCELLDETIREIGDNDQVFSILRSKFKAITSPNDGENDFLFPKR